MRQVCGLDVRKDSVFACILNGNGVVFQEKFGVLTPELEQLAAALQRCNIRIRNYVATTDGKSYKDECQSKMDSICQKYFPEQFKNLLTIPGIKGRSATRRPVRVSSAPLKDALQPLVGHLLFSFFVKMY